MAAAPVLSSPLFPPHPRTSRRVAHSSTTWPPVSRSWRISRSMSALLLRPAPMPAIEMAGFECVSPVCFPVIEMAGFRSRSLLRPGGRNGRVCQAQIHLAHIARTNARGLDGCLAADCRRREAPRRRGFDSRSAVRCLAWVSEDTKAEMFWGWLRNEPRELLRGGGACGPHHLTLRSGLGALLRGGVESCIGGLAMPLGNEFHNRMRSTSLSVISSFVRS